MKLLLVSPDTRSRELMSLAAAGIERRVGEPLEFIESTDGENGRRVALAERPDVIVADQTASRAGGFSLARDLRWASEPYPGAIVLLLERRQDGWLARWSGADAWFVKPVDPFELADRLAELVTSKERV